MSNKKHTGSYYTPDYLSDFIVKRVSLHLTGGKTISISSQVSVTAVF